MTDNPCGNLRVPLTGSLPIAYPSNPIEAGMEKRSKVGIEL
jgi:hypothetical protein